MDKNTTNWVIGGVALIVVVLLGWWLFTKAPAATDTDTDTGTSTGQNDTDTATGTNTGTSSGTSTGVTVDVNTGEEVTAEDQPAGDSVRVVEAKLSRVSWLAVRDDMRIYGAARVHPPAGGGTMGDITIPLLRNTESGKTYRVVVYADDGDGVFDFKVDALVEGLDDSFTALNGD